MSMLEVKDLQVYYGVIQAIEGNFLSCRTGRSYRADRCEWRR